MNWKVVAVLILAFGGLAFAAGWRSKPTPPKPLPPLPVEKLVPVEIIKEIKVPGPERVVERVRWKTKTVQVPVETTKTITKIVCDQENPDRQLLGDIQIDAQKYEGEADGKLVQGWAGTATCSVAEMLADGATGPLLTLFEEPFDLHSSRAESIVPVAAHLPEWERRPHRTEIRLGLTTAPGATLGVSRYGKRRLGWFVTASVDWSPEEWTAYQETQDGAYLARQTAQSARVGAGLAFSFGRR